MKNKFYSVNDGYTFKNYTIFADGACSVQWWTKDDTHIKHKFLGWIKSRKKAMD